MYSFQNEKRYATYKVITKISNVFKTIYFQDSTKTLIYTLFIQDRQGTKLLAV